MTTIREPSTEQSFKTISFDLLSLALPMALTQLVAISSGFISMVMLSSLGHDVLAASALISSTRITLLVIGSSILFALSILIGHAYGERQHQRIGNFVQLGWTMGLILSIPILIIYWNIEPILLHFGQSPVLTHIVKEFFHANIWNVPAFLLSVSNQQLCYGTRKQRVDLYANVLGVMIMLIAAYTLIFGHFGAPKLGVAGFGYALDIQGWFYFSFTTLVIYSSRFFDRFDIFTFRLHESFRDLKHMLKIAWPICVQIDGEMLSFFVSATMVGWMGVQSLAAYQVVIQYLFLILVPLFSLSQASGVLVGQAFGEKNFLKISKVGYAGIMFSFYITVFYGLIFIIFPKQLASLYLNIHDPVNAKTVHLIVILFAIVAIQQMVDAIRNVITGSLRGLFDTRYPMYVGLCVIWLIGIPLGYLLAFKAHFGVPGFAMGGTVGMFIGMVLMVRRWQKQNRLRASIQVTPA